MIFRTQHKVSFYRPSIASVGCSTDFVYGKGETSEEHVHFLVRLFAGTILSLITVALGTSLYILVATAVSINVYACVLLPLTLIAALLRLGYLSERSKAETKDHNNAGLSIETRSFFTRVKIKK